MRSLVIPGLLALVATVTFCQTATQKMSFDVASVKASQRLVGPDYNNQLTFLPRGITGRNVTLRKLAAAAYHLQLNQIVGQSWLDQNEYDLQAQASVSVPTENLGIDATKPACRKIPSEAARRDKKHARFGTCYR